MTIQLMTLLALIVAIFIGAKFKVNTGIVSIAFAFLLGYFIMGMSPSDIYKGFPSTTIFRLIGMTFLFGIAKVNGTLSFTAKKFSSFARGNAKLIPILMYFVAFLLSAVGPGAVVVCAILFPIAMEIAEDNGVPDMLMFTTVISGALGGGLAPITATGIVASSLSEQVGVTNYMQIWLSGGIVFTLEAVFCYIVFGGYKLKGSSQQTQAEAAVINGAQKLTLCILAITLIGMIVPKTVVPFLEWDLALAPFVSGTILLLLHAAEQDKVISSIPWTTILLISGVSMLVNVITVAGGIDALAQFLSSIMTPHTASAIMAMLSGLMSSVSSGTGVVMPTLIPTAPEIVSQMGGTVSVSSLASAVIIGCSVVTYSPLSTLGALAFANATDREDKDTLFTKLLICGVLAVLFAGLLGLLGIYR